MSDKIELQEQALFSSVVVVEAQMAVSTGAEGHTIFITKFSHKEQGKSCSEISVGDIWWETTCADRICAHDPITQRFVARPFVLETSN